MLEQWLISLFDLLAQDVTVGENFKPELRNFFISKVVVFILLFLLSEQLSDLLKVNIGESVGAWDDIVDIVGEWRKGGSEISLNSFDFCLELFVNLPLLN